MSWDRRRRDAVTRAAVEVLQDPNASRADKREAKRALAAPDADDVMSNMSDDELATLSYLADKLMGLEPEGHLRVVHVVGDPIKRQCRECIEREGRVFVELTRFGTVQRATIIDTINSLPKDDDEQEQADDDDDGPDGTSGAHLT